MRRNARQEQINRLRDERFDRHFDRMDKMMDNPVKTVVSMWIIGAAISLIGLTLAVLIIMAILNGFGVI